jgi:sarcosine oxidase
MIAESPGFKFAHHLPTDGAVDPDAVSREPKPGEREDLRKILTTYLPAADGPLLALKTCLYTNTPDGHFIIDNYPGHPGVQIACGFSGHGFKFASVIGELLAEASVTGKLDPTLEFLRLARFGFGVGAQGGIDLEHG